MKNHLALLLGAALLAGCSPFNTVQLYRDETAFPAFMQDRGDCMSKAHKCVVERYANSSYHGETAEHLLPSRRVYLGCMYQRGYVPSASGYLPPVLQKMNDYEPGRECFGL